MKKRWIRIFILPNLRSAAELLRCQDEDSTGIDDEAAEAIEYAVELLERWLQSADV